MRLEIVIRVTEEKVVVEVPERGWRKEYTKFIALRNENIIVGVGETLEEIQESYRQKKTVMTEPITFLHIYDPKNFNPDITTSGFYYFVFTAKRNFHINKIDLKIWLPGNYLDSIGDIHQHFEYHLQENLGLNSLEINGLPVSWPQWQRKLVRYYSFVPLLITFFFLWKLLPAIYPVNRTWISTIFAQMAEPWNTLDTVINFMSTFVLLGLLWGGATVLLLVIYRFFVPKTLFLIHQASFPSRGGVGEKWLIWLAERLLVDAPIFSPKTS